MQVLPSSSASTGPTALPHGSACCEPPQSPNYLQDDAALDEVIKRDLPPSLSVKLANEDVMKLVREPVTFKEKRESEEWARRQTFPSTHTFSFQKARSPLRHPVTNGRGWGGNTRCKFIHMHSRN